MRVEVKNVKKERQNQKKLKISQFFPNVNEQLADPTSIRSLSYDSQAVEIMNLESAAEQTFDTALHTESENEEVNDVNESMQTSTNVENRLNQKTNISFTNFKRTYDGSINRYLKKEHFRVLTNRETIKRNWMLYSGAAEMTYCSACKLFAESETHFTSGLNDYKNINRLHEHENSKVTEYINAKTEW